MKDLIYCEDLENRKEIEQTILKRFPKTIINDASDKVHRERIEIDLGDGKHPITDEYIKFAVRNGFSQGSFGIQLLLTESSKKTMMRIERLRKEIAGEKK